MKYFLILLILLPLVSCKEKKEEGTLFPSPVKGSINIKYSNLQLDTIILNDEGVESSLMGFSGITNDKNIYFIDSRFCWYYVFDLNGNFKKRSFGSGQGPKETTIGKIATCCILDNSDLFLLGYNVDHYVYDKNFDKKKSFILPHPYIDKSSVDDMSTDWRTYSHQYSNLICRNYKEKVYMHIFSEHPDFYYMGNTKDFLKKSNHILEVDIALATVGNMYASGYPPVYYGNPYDYTLLAFNINFDIDKKGDFYVSYEADSLIYKYDNNYKPLYSFGYSGKNMNMKFERVRDWSEYKKYKKQERIDKGYYHWVEYVDETGLLFRSYKKGSHDTSDGLQIYSDRELLADISVPKGLKVAGYVAPYYYSQAIADEEKEILVVYRFKLE
jgi:hypothetical protein